MKPARNHDKYMKALHYIEEGMPVGAACAAAGISSNGVFYLWIRRIRGTALHHLYERFVEAAGKYCDMCGDKEMSRKMRVRRENYDSAPIEIRFCSEECEQLWDEQDQRSYKGANVAEVLGNTGTRRSDVESERSELDWEFGE